RYLAPSTGATIPPETLLPGEVGGRIANEPEGLSRSKDRGPRHRSGRTVPTRQGRDSSGVRKALIRRPARPPCSGKVPPGQKSGKPSNTMKLRLVPLSDPVEEGKWTE